MMMKTLNKLFLIAFLLLFWQATFTQIMVKTITNSFNGSGGLQMGKDGMLYIADFGQGLDNANGTTVWRLDYKNEAQPKVYATGLSGASGNDFDSQGNLFQSNIGGNSISKIDANGNTSFFTSSGISCSVGINIDLEDNLYICNCCGTFGNTIRKVSKIGASSLFSSSPLFFCPNGITRDENDNLYVSNFSNGNVIKINPQGQASLLATTRGIAPSNGHIIYSEKEKVLYVASHGAHRIYKLELNGNLSVLAGSGSRGNRDGTALQATFSRPNGLALSVTEDTLFVNSSIPTTDTGGRPLNPSVIRIITGLRTTTAIQNKTLEGLEFIHDPYHHTILIKGLPSNEIQVKILDARGTIWYQKSNRIANQHLQLDLPTSLVNGIYFLQLLTKKGDGKTHKFAIVN